MRITGDLQRLLYSDAAFAGCETMADYQAVPVGDVINVQRMMVLAGSNLEGVPFFQRKLTSCSSLR